MVDVAPDPSGAHLALPDVVVQIYALSQDVGSEVVSCGIVRTARIAPPGEAVVLADLRHPRGASPLISASFLQPRTVHNRWLPVPLSGPTPVSNSHISRSSFDAQVATTSSLYGTRTPSPGRIVSIGTPPSS